MDGYKLESPSSPRIIAIRILTVLALLALGGAAHAGAEVGTPAPDFTLDGHDGNTYTLSDYTPGKVVFLAHIGYG